MIDVVLCALAAVAGAWGVRWAWRVPEEEQLSEEALDFLAAQLLDDQVTLAVSDQERLAVAYSLDQSAVRFFESGRAYEVAVVGGKRYHVFGDGTWRYVGSARRHGYVSSISD